MLGRSENGCYGFITVLLLFKKKLYFNDSDYSLSRISDWTWLREYLCFNLFLLGYYGSYTYGLSFTYLFKNNRFNLNFINFFLNSLAIISSKINFYHSDLLSILKYRPMFYFINHYQTVQRLQNLYMVIYLQFVAAVCTSRF